MRKLQSYWASIVSLFRKVEYTGITLDTPYLLNRYIRMVNLIAIAAFFTALSYCIGNILGGHPLLAIVDISYILAALVVFRFNNRGQYKKASIYLLISTSIFISIINFFSYNIAEYYLICVLIASILVFHNIWSQTIIAVYLVTMILLPEFFVEHLPSTHAVGQDRLFINVPLAVFFIFMLIRYFKTVQQQYQNEIKRQHVHLEEMNRDKEQLFAIVAHDIRSPLLVASQIFQQAFDEKMEPEHKKEILRQINKQLIVLTNNIDNLLHWSSQNLQGLVSRPSLFSAQVLMQQIIDSMICHAQEKQIQFDMQIDPQLTVYADIEHIRIVFRNLLNNAVKFSYPETEIKIKATGLPSAVQISITDQGIGMSAKKVKELFNLIQSPAYGTAGERGTGLGLILVHNLLSINSGKIDVQSFEQEGSTFHIQLPLETPA